MTYGKFRGAPRPLQLQRQWKINDEKAYKSGTRRTLYWAQKKEAGEEGVVEGEPFTQGQSYQGEWKNNLKDGYGIQQYANGNKYEGQWSESRRHGEGVLWAKVGSKLRKVYTGGWLDDKKHGEGTYFYQGGDSYQGSWELGRRHGQGTMRYADGSVYIGTWHTDLRCGTGTLSKANGDCYEGTWLDDKREGTGSYFYASGKVLVAEWEADVPKAGIYTQATQAAPAAGEEMLARLRLAEPAQVLESALTAVRTSRTPFRATHTPLTQLFTQEELDELRPAFDAAKVNDKISLLDLVGLYLSLGVEITEGDLVDLLGTIVPELIEELTGPEKHSVPLSFEHFARTIALVLDHKLADTTLLEDEY